MGKAAIPTEQTPSAQTAGAAEPSNYEQALTELEALVSAMENAQLPLDSYRRGAQLLQFCRARLQDVEQQVKLLERGELEPWSGK
jgi:exodeoxyribonuclease VII small subunit